MINKRLQIDQTANNIHNSAIDVDNPFIADPIFSGQLNGNKDYGILRPHGRKDWLIIFTVDGFGRIATNNDEHITKRGEIILYPPQIKHDYKISSNANEWNILWAHFLPLSNLIELLSFPELNGGARCLSITDNDLLLKIESTMQEVVNSYAQGHKWARRFSYNALERVFLLCDQLNPVKGLTIDIRIRKSIEWLWSNMDKKILIEDIAKNVNISPSHFAHLFCNQVGLSPMKYLENIRLKKARELLFVSTYNISEVSRTVGFDSPFHFSERFKKLFGQSPRDFRKKVFN